MKIMHIITGLSTGGAEMMLYKLISHTDRLHFENVVVSLTDKGTLGNKIENIGIPVFALNMMPWRLLSVLRKEQPHIVQTWLYHADLLGLIIGKLMRVPVIVWNLRCSNVDMRHCSTLSAFVMYTTTKLSTLPDVVLVNSNAGRQYHEALGYNPTRWQQIPNGFDIEQFHYNQEARIKLRNELRLSSDTILIGLIARFDPMKDHKTFLHAASLLLKDYSDVHFLMVGRGIDHNNNILVNTIKSFGIENFCHLLGERNDISDIITTLDISCSSSSYGEGFPNVIGEAMACEIPCVVTDVGDSSMILGGTGRVVPPKNPMALAKALNELIYIGLKGRKELGLAARHRIEENFSLSAIVAQYEKLYEELYKCAE